MTNILCNHIQVRAQASLRHCSKPKFLFETSKERQPFSERRAAKFLRFPNFNPTRDNMNTRLPICWCHRKKAGETEIKLYILSSRK